MKTKKTYRFMPILLSVFIVLMNVAFGQEMKGVNAKPSIGTYFLPQIEKYGVKMAIESFRQQKLELTKTYEISGASLREVGIDLLNKNQIEDAIEVLKFTVEEFPNFARATYSLGYVYREAGKNKLAIKCFEKSLKLDPTDTRAIDRLNEIRRKKNSPEEIKQDLAFLYKTLEDSHYDLYMHTKKAVFETEYKKINESIKDSLTILQINRLFAPLITLSMVGHCRIEDIEAGYDDYRRSKGTVFPYDVSFAGNRVLIEVNYSDRPDIVKGDEILSINGKGIAIVMVELYRHLSGESDYNKNTLIEAFGFPFVYWFVNDESKIFNILAKKPNGEKYNAIIDAITVSDYNSKSANKARTTNRNREFRFIDNIAYLHPGAFYNISAANSSMEEMYGKTGEFLHFLDTSFFQIKINKAKNLIIDLRGNPGGDNSFSDPMVAYFASKPFAFYSKFSYRTSKITKECLKDVEVSNRQCYQ